MLLLYSLLRDPKDKNMKRDLSPDRSITINLSKSFATLNGSAEEKEKQNVFKEKINIQCLTLQTHSVLLLSTTLSTTVPDLHSPIPRCSLCTEGSVSLTFDVEY